MLKTAFKKNTWDLIGQFVRTEFKLKYNNSVLGFVWVLIKPLFIFLILYLVMSKVFPNGSVEFFALYLLLGTIISGHFNEATSSGINSLLNKQNLILKVNFPRYIVIISSMLLPAINFIINLVVYFFISIAFFGRYPGLIAILWFLVAYLSLFLLMLGFSLFTSIWHVKLRDIGSIWELMTQLIFWLTPVFYNADVIKEKSALFGFLITEANPVSVFLMATREAFIYNRISNTGIVMIWLGISAVIAGLGYVYFKTNVKKIAEDF